MDDLCTAGRDRMEIGRLTVDRVVKVASPSIARGLKAVGRRSNVPGRTEAGHSTDLDLKAVGRHSIARGLKAVGRHSIALDRMGTGLRTRAATVGSPSIARSATIDHRVPIVRGRTARVPSVRPETGRGRSDRAATAATAVRRSTGRADRGRLAEEIGRAATSAVRQANTLRVRSERRAPTRQS